MVTSDLKLVAKSSSVAFWSRLYALALQYLTALIIARVLGLKLMGSFFLGFAILSVLSVFCQVGLGSGILKFLSIRLLEEDYEYAKRILLFSVKCILGASLGIAAVTYISRNMLSLHVFADPDLKLVLLFIAATIPFYSLFLFSIEALKAFKRIGSLVAVQHLLFPTVHLLLLVVLFGMGLRLSSPLISILLATVLSVAAFLSLFRKVLLQGAYNSGRALDAREIFSVSIPLYLAYIMALLTSWTDTLMLGIFKTSQEVGLYTAAAKTAVFVAFLLTAVNYIMPPLAAQLYERGEKLELESLARRTARWNLIFSVTVTMAFVLFGKEILSLFGHEFVISYIPLLFLSLGQVVNAGAGSVGYILAMTGFQKILTYIATFSAILNVLLNALLIPLFSIAGAALATGFVIALVNILNAYFVTRRVGIVPYADTIPKATGYLLMAGAISFAA
ncbi:MAG: flippase, partial [Deltaproteobacteria bacterium]|nr:flippase [Deltaproteobacteria bacterium]